MQRLIRPFRRRAQDERGATAVMFALLLVPMLGFAAIAVDVGALYAEKARLQVAADAAAIAVAQDCSRGSCGDMLATAQSLITANDGEGTAAHPVLSNAPLSVTVVGSTPKEHWFAPILGHDSTAVSAIATVRASSTRLRDRRPPWRRRSSASASTGVRSVSGSSPTWRAKTR